MPITFARNIPSFVTIDQISFNSLPNFRSRSGIGNHACAHLESWKSWQPCEARHLSNSHPLQHCHIGMFTLHWVSKLSSVASIYFFVSSELTGCSCRLHLTHPTVRLYEGFDACFMLKGVICSLLCAPRYPLFSKSNQLTNFYQAHLVHLSQVRRGFHIILLEVEHTGRFRWRVVGPTPSSSGNLSIAYFSVRGLLLHCDC